ncbi:MAG TPA: nucleotidyltransferase family protein [Bacteroidota bacterium]|nr:nucleotidyltransferase family protein [Bacteroidota bacterium]
MRRKPVTRQTPRAVVGIVVLAAGPSKRFGSPKQLALIGHSSLLRRSVETALQAHAHSTAVVLGANAMMVEKELHGLPVTIRYNEEWKEGMGSTIRVGIRMIPAECTAAIIMLADQPAVDSELLNRLIDRHSSTNKPIVACEYDGAPGVPALFARSMFEDLLSIRGDRGAKELIRLHLASTATIPFPGGSIDVDTSRDLENYLSKRGR